MYILQQWSMVNGWVEVGRYKTEAAAQEAMQPLLQRYKGVYKFGSTHRIIKEYLK